MNVRIYHDRRFLKKIHHLPCIPISGNVLRIFASHSELLIDNTLNFNVNDVFIFMPKSLYLTMIKPVKHGNTYYGKRFFKKSLRNTKVVYDHIIGSVSNNEIFVYFKSEKLYLKWKLKN